MTGFPEHSHSGLFIDIEGLDGSGSSTQVQLLADYFEDLGYSVLTTKEPTNNVIGGLIRGGLTKDVNLDDRTFQLLFAADRSHHLYREVEPALAKGWVVITDRYFWSTLAFGYSAGLDYAWLGKLNEKFIRPDISIIIQVQPDISIERIQNSRFDVEYFEEKEKLEKAWQGYEKIKSDYNGDITIVNGNLSINEVAKNIQQVVESTEGYQRLVEQQLV